MTECSLPNDGAPQAGRRPPGLAGRLWNGTANVCGVLALVISVSWTFPREIVTAYFSTQDAMDKEVNDAIREMARIYKDFTLSQSSVLSDQMRFNLTTVSAAQIGYELDKLSRLPSSVFARASYTANLALAGFAFQIPKYDDAVRYYTAAIAAAKREKIDAQEAYQGEASALLGQGGIGNIEAARQNYRLALAAAWTRQKTGRADYAFAPLATFIEISLGEMRFGSWECGDQIATLVDLQLSRPEMISAAPLVNLLAVYRANRSAIVKVEGRLPFACDYLSAAR